MRYNNMNKRAFRRLSLLTLLALVFGQLSLSAYACSALLFDDTAPMAAVVAADADCHGQSVAEPRDVQCDFHCQVEPTVTAAASPDLSPDQCAPALDIELRAGAPLAATARQRNAALAMATAPPVSVRFCRFLI